MVISSNHVFKSGLAELFESQLALTQDLKLKEVLGFFV